MSAEQKLAELGLTLPDIPTPLANYVPFKRAALLAMLVFAPLAARAHPLDLAAPLGPVELEVMGFRHALQEAIAAKDVVKLRAMYADSFTHTHGSGKMDGKDTRIVAALAGDPVIETAPVDELSFRPSNSPSVALSHADRTALNTAPLACFAIAVSPPATGPPHG